MTDWPTAFISYSQLDRERKDRFARHLTVSPDLWGPISSRWMPEMFRSGQHEQALQQR